MTTTPHRRAAGFTLIELMVTVLIASILLTIAVPMYSAQMRQSRRTEARTALLQIGQREERFFSTNSAYSQLPSDLGYGGAAWPMTVGTGYYTVSVTAAGSTYTATATPTTLGKQSNDTSCAQFTLNQAGQQGATDSSNSDTSATCWTN